MKKNNKENSKLNNKDKNKEIIKEINKEKNKRSFYDDDNKIPYFEKNYETASTSSKSPKNDFSFNHVKFIRNLMIIVAIAIFIFLGIKIYNSVNDQISFHSVSLKADNNVSDKEAALSSAYEMISNSYDSNEQLDPTNLTLAHVYDEVKDVEEPNIKANAPVPVMSEEEEADLDDITLKSSAFQIFALLQEKYKVLNQSLYNLCDTNPVNVVREYHYSGWSIIGKYNPEVPSHEKGKRYTWFIQNFQNVNLRYFDGDGNRIDEDNNIKDIMSMASVYTYYKDPYDTKTFLKYCYDLFDRSYTYKASISEVYYCSGCMHYDDPNVATDSQTKVNTTIDVIKNTSETQKVLPKDIPYKAGTLTKMEEGSAKTTDGNYEDYVSDIKEGKNVTTNNYCPGHIDLNVDVTVMTLDASNGLASIDKNYGNKGMNFNKNWHGWNAIMLKNARTLFNRDWEKEYGISISYIDFVKPLTQEEINYYLNRLDKSTTPNRKKLIEVALRSVGRIPYYFGGKTSRFGYEANYFGTKVPADYKGRCLKGLDCSGWINWVYGTAFNKYMIKSDGTAKLAGEGTKITRKELLPGDIIVRPGIDSHVMMFLEWSDGGKVTVIHENGSVNNVSIGTFDAYYPYYRRIINS